MRSTNRHESPGMKKGRGWVSQPVGRGDLAPTKGVSKWFNLNNENSEKQDTCG